MNSEHEPRRQPATMKRDACPQRKAGSPAKGRPLDGLLGLAADALIDEFEAAKRRSDGGAMDRNVRPSKKNPELSLRG
jgi:hypothetical protein